MAEIFARFNISVRAGHHCAEPLMSYFNIPNGLTRISFHIYNTEEDINKVIEALKEVKKIFGNKKHQYYLSFIILYLNILVKFL